ncbi:ABC transporter permease [Lichenibacterium minor]|uniref:ABC transporter permease n=1 Tax=Lichenibacterium minor TaxID=2316528 RepID=A0A4Q2UAS8_9HYPH|nr:ABC transporter permease [Lichenibacterium minor]RYC33740.1 ABC transporter permease [Lichenibacterium minor]
MAALLLRRFAGLVVTLLLTSAAIFAALDVLPGDPAAVMLGTAARPDTLAALRAEMGLDRPAPLRYAAWLGGAVTGHLGTSTTYGVPVAGLVADRLAVTLPLALVALALAVGAALPLGVAAAARRGGALDAAAAVFAQGTTAVPGFWIGLLLVLLFAVRLGWMPAGGFPGWAGGATPALRALLLPAIALALPQAGVLTRVARGAMLDALGEDFIRTARAKGLRPRTVLWRHALRNALPAILTVLGLQLSFLVAGAVLVETVFALPGLGRLAVQAFAQRDAVVVQDVVLLLAAFVILVNFAVDLAGLALDPRQRDAA